MIVNQVVNVSGYWQTNYKNMMLYQYGNRVIGRYNLYNGVIEGTLNGNVLSGMWFQTPEAIFSICKYGPIRFIFTENTFTGTWGECESLGEGNWNGNRIELIEEDTYNLLR